jgi:hypothetical protein
MRQARPAGAAGAFRDAAFHDPPFQDAEMRGTRVACCGALTQPGSGAMSAKASKGKRRCPVIGKI